VRLPTYVFVVTLDFVTYELRVAPDKSSYCYRPCSFSKVFEPKQRAMWRSLKPTEMMIKVSHNCYLVTHVCVDACHCPHCGSDVGVLCQTTLRRGAGKLTTSTHYKRRDLYRAALRDSN